MKNIPAVLESVLGSPELGASAKLLHQRLDTAVEEGRLDLTTFAHFEGFMEVLAERIDKHNEKFTMLKALAAVHMGQAELRSALGEDQ